MKTDVDILDDIFQYLKGNTQFWNAAAAVGFIDYTTLSIIGRRENSTKEEIVISILSNGGATEMQEAFVNVNVYVKDLMNTIRTSDAGNIDTFVPDLDRLNAMSHICADALKDVFGDTFRFNISQQQIFEDKENHMHFVNNKLLYNQINL